MKILSIETSCDETAVSVLECSGNTVQVHGNALATQIELHAQYGGVFPALAKLEHAKKIVPLLKEVLSQAGLLHQTNRVLEADKKEKIEVLCTHEQGLAGELIALYEQCETPDIAHIAVTTGPGLEPALWVGINTAKALSILWQKPIDATNHMEGHVLSAIFQEKKEREFIVAELEYPLLALLVSGGHTELVLVEKPLSYKKIGATRDDAVGEAFDKVARILGLPYPGGPKISALAKEIRLKANSTQQKAGFSLPRPMLHSSDYDFSFSGLKTAVLYATRDKELNEDDKKSIAREFEDAVIEVLTAKTFGAVEEFGIQTLVVGGGVAANMHLREEFEKIRAEKFPSLVLSFPTKDLSTDNSIMIGMASYYRHLHGAPLQNSTETRADGNRSIEEESIIAITQQKA